MYLHRFQSEGPKTSSNTSWMNGVLAFAFLINSPGIAWCFCARRSGLWDPSALTGSFPSAFHLWSLRFYTQTSAPEWTQDWDSDRLFPPQRNSGLARNVPPTVTFISLALWELIIIMVNTLLQPCHHASLISFDFLWAWGLLPVLLGLRQDDVLICSFIPSFMYSTFKWVFSVLGNV